MEFTSTQHNEHKWVKIKQTTVSMKQLVLPLKSLNGKHMFLERKIKIKLKAKFLTLLRKTKHS